MATGMAGPNSCAAPICAGTCASARPVLVYYHRLDRALVHACRVGNHPGGQVRSNPTPQTLETGIRVGKLPEGPITQSVEIELVFGSVYASFSPCRPR